MQPNQIYKCFNPKVFLHQNKQAKSYSKIRGHLFRKIGSVYLKFEKKTKTKNKQTNKIKLCTL